MDNGSEVDWRAFGSPDTSADALAAAFSSAPTLNELTGDKVGSALLWRAVYHGDDDVAYHAVDHPDVTSEMLLTLCWSHDRDARNSRGSAEPDGDATSFRDFIAPDHALRHRLMPAGVFDRIAEHADPRWRAAAVTNPRTPDTELRRLGDDRDEHVQFEVAVNVPVDQLPDQFDHFKYSNVAVVARRDDLTVEQLTVLARHPNTAIRTVVASRLDLPDRVRTILGDDPDRWVRRVVANH